MRDLIIGAADLYKGHQVRVWMKSARLSGYSGHMALIVYRVERSVLDECLKWDVEVVEAKLDHTGTPIHHDDRSRNTQSHQMRFFHIWQYLNEEREKQRSNGELRIGDDLRGRIIITDVRDVCFQSNPMVYLNAFPFNSYKVIASSEGLQYQHEPWGADNMKNGFSSYVYDYMKDKRILNVGTLAGQAQAMADLSLNLYSMGTGRYIPNDQSSFNILAQTLLKDVINVDPIGWACQCGTRLDPQKASIFKPHFIDDAKRYDTAIENGFLVPMAGCDPYIIVHQYDRVPILKRIIEERYL